MTCEPPADRSVLVIVIENGGRYGAQALCSATAGKLGKPEYRFVETPNKSAALNAILPELSGHLVVFLDDDVRVDPNLLVEYAAAAGKRTEGEFYGGGLLIDYEQAPPEWLKKYLPKSATGWHPSIEDYAPLGKMHFFGANWAAFSFDLLRLGGFNAQFGPGSKMGATGQETQMQKDLVGVGVRPRYVPEAVVWHYVPKSRCSPEWAIDRARRMGVRSGHVRAGSHNDLTLLGIPRWLWKATFLAALERAWLTAKRADAEELFRARLHLAERIGEIAGAFRSHRAKRTKPCE